jgi:hypothetical protein
MAHRKIVINPHLMLALIEQSNRVRSDVSSTPNNQNAHSILSSSNKRNFSLTTPSQCNRSNLGGIFMI